MSSNKNRPPQQPPINNNINYNPNAPLNHPYPPPPPYNYPMPRIVGVYPPPPPPGVIEAMYQMRRPRLRYYPPLVYPPYPPYYPRVYPY